MNKSLFLSILMAVAMLIVCPLQMWADADPVVYAADGAYEIDDAAKWNTFVSLVDGGQYNLNARLTADITDSVTTMVGLTEAKAYTGVFDGQGHTLCIKLVAAGEHCAPFSYINGATIKDLHVAGTINAQDKQFAAGIVGYASGASKLLNLWSSVNITSTRSGDGTYGGILARNNAAGNNTHCTVISNCLFDGSMVGANVSNNAGIAGWLHDKSTATVSNCLVVGKLQTSTTGCAIITRNTGNNAATISNCYYLNTISYGTAQGTAVTAAQLASGEVCCQLLNQGDEGVATNWRQKLDTDTVPHVTKADDNIVYKACSAETSYTNVAPTHTYVNGICSVCGKLETPTQDANGNYLIANAGNLKWFANRVNSRTPSACAKLVADIDLTGVAYQSIGNGNAFSGTLDGDNHSISNLTGMALINVLAAQGVVTNVYLLNASNKDNWQVEDYQSPFVRRNWGTIKNCVVANSYWDSSKNYLGGITGVNEQGAKVMNCACYNTTLCIRNGVNAAAGGITAINIGIVQSCYTWKNTYNNPSNLGSAALAQENRSGASVINCYTDHGTSVKTNNGATISLTTGIADSFVNGGALTNKLNFGVTNGTQTWYQKINTDSVPHFVSAEDNVVYRVNDSTYTNIEPTYNFVNGICTITGELQTPTQDANGTYLIANVGNLKWFANQVNNGNALACAKLMVDIDLSAVCHAADTTATDTIAEASWTPVGCEAAPFSGTFDGANHTISNLYIVYTQNFQGFFGYVKGNGNRAVVKNLTVRGEMSTTTGGDQIGGIAGHGENADFVHVYNKVNITVTNVKSKHIGGIVGSAYGITVTDCVNDGVLNVGASSDCIGGIVGYNTGATTITHCLNRGNITSSTDNAYIGGMLGYNNNADFKGASYCANMGRLIGGTTNTNTGAIFGCYKKKAAAVGVGNVYLADTNVKAVGSNSSGQNLGTFFGMTAEQFTNGDVCRRLGSHLYYGDTCVLCGNGKWDYNLMLFPLNGSFSGWTASNSKLINNGSFFVAGSSATTISQTLTLSDFGFTTEDFSEPVLLYSGANYYVPYKGSNTGTANIKVECLSATDEVLKTHYLVQLAPRNVEYPETFVRGVDTIPANTAKIRMSFIGDDQLNMSGNYGPGFGNACAMSLHRGGGLEKPFSVTVLNDSVVTVPSMADMGDTIRLVSAYPIYLWNTDTKVQRVEANAFIMPGCNVAVSPEMAYSHAVEQVANEHVTLTFDTIQGHPGDTIHITSCVVEEGYRFKSYADNGTVASWIDGTSFIMKNEAVHITVNLYGTKKITFTSPKQITATINRTTAICGDTIRVQISGIEDGYRFANLALTPSCTKLNDTTFIMPDADVTATIEQYETLPVSVVTNEHATISLNRTTALCGDTVSVRISQIDKGYRFNNITISPSATKLNDTTFLMPNAATVVTVNLFEKHAISVVTDSVVVASVSAVAALYGDTIVVHAHSLDSLRAVTGYTLSPAATKLNDSTFLMPDAALTITPVLGVNNAYYLGIQKPGFSYFWTDGAYGWNLTESGTASGRFMPGLKSNNYQKNSTDATQSLSIKSNASFILEFDYYVESESSYDKLTIKFDNTTVVNLWSGSSNKSRHYKSSLQAAGEHHLSLTYHKDGSTSTGLDRGFIYNIKVIPLHTITLSGDDHATLTGPAQAYAGDTVTLHPLIEDSYPFEGYVGTNVNWVNDSVFVMPYEDVIITLSSHSLEPHTITAASDAAVSLSASKAEALMGDTITLSKNVAAGYSFIAYTTTPDVTWVNDSSFVMPDAAITISATWQANRYIVVFDDFDGTVLKRDTVLYNAAVTAPADPVRQATQAYTYTFAGWNASFDHITEDIIITAQYNKVINRYVASFFNYDGAILKRDTVDYNTAATAPTNPIREATAKYSYIFEKWSTYFNAVTENIDITAQYDSIINHYVASFVDYDGTVLKRDTVLYNTAATAPADPTRAATAEFTYTFTGWAGEYSNLVADVTITAQYSSVTNRYVATFVDYNGTVLKRDTVNYGTAATAPADPTREATAEFTYTFTGWAGEYSNLVADVTITAQYSSVTNKYVATFVDYNGTVLKRDTVDYNTAATAPADPTREATAEFTYTFSGWEGSFANVTADVTITAQYNVVTNKYVATFVDYNGTVLKRDTVDYNTAATAPADPTREATAEFTYTFSGWEGSFANVTADVTITAQYTEEAVLYVVTFEDYDGTVLKRDTVTYNAAATAPADPTREGYRFTGWNGEFSNVTANMTVTAQYEEIDTTGFDGIDANRHAIKRIEDGKVIIETPDGRIYDSTGRLIR